MNRIFSRERVILAIISLFIALALPPFWALFVEDRGLGYPSLILLVINSGFVLNIFGVVFVLLQWLFAYVVVGFLWLLARSFVKRT